MTTQAPRVPRGIRNNNPGNIRLSPTRWRGEVDGTDSAFETFDTPENGIRAMARLLLTYQRRHGLDTVEDIIGRWAPPIENDTDSYAQAVARALDVGVRDRVNLADETTLTRIVVAIIRHENGQQPYRPAQIADGVRRAMSG